MGDHDPLGVPGTATREEQDVGVALAERGCIHIVGRLCHRAREEVGAVAGRRGATWIDPLNIGKGNLERSRKRGAGGGMFSVDQQQGRTRQSSRPLDLCWT
jgi:hypothetical protein